MAIERKPHRLTEEHKANISTGTKAALASPEVKTRLSLTQLRIWEQNPQRRQEQALTQIRLWQDPKHREKMIKSRIGVRLSKEHKKSISIALSGKPSPLRGCTISEEHKAKISIAKKKRDSLKKQEQQIQKSPTIQEEGVAEENIDLNLWRSAIEENLIGTILNQNLLTKEEIGRIKMSLEAGRKPPEKLMDKFSIAVARTA